MLEPELQPETVTDLDVANDAGREETVEESVEEAHWAASEEGNQSECTISTFRPIVQYCSDNIITCYSKSMHFVVIKPLLYLN